MKKCQNCEFARQSYGPDTVHCSYIARERSNRNIDNRLGDIYNYADSFQMEQKLIRELESDPRMCRSDEEFNYKFLSKELPDLKIYTGWANPSQRIHSNIKSSGMMFNFQYLTEKDSVCKFYEESSELIQKRENIKNLFIVKK